MTAPYRRASVETILADYQRRIRALEATFSQETHAAEMSMTNDWTNPSNGNNTITFDGVVFDTDGYSHLGPPTYFQIPTGMAGWYTCDLSVCTTGNAATGPSVSIYRATGNPWVFRDVVQATQIDGMCITMVAYMAAGDQAVPTLGKVSGTQIVDGGIIGPFLRARFSIARIGATYPP